jgi:hypothetical protein
MDAHETQVRSELDDRGGFHECVIGLQSGIVRQLVGLAAAGDDLVMTS